MVTSVMTYNVMSDLKVAIRYLDSPLLFYLTYLMDSKVPDYVIILSPAHFFISLVIATVGRQI